MMDVVEEHDFWHRTSYLPVMRFLFAGYEVSELAVLLLDIHWLCDSGKSMRRQGRKHPYGARWSVGRPLGIWMEFQKD